MWIRVWQSWAHGEYKNHSTYHEVYDEDELKSLLSEFNDQWEWSDKYRGSKFEVVEFPPVEFLEKEIKRLNADAVYSLKRAEELKALKETIPS